MRGGSTDLPRPPAEGLGSGGKVWRATEGEAGIKAKASCSAEGTWRGPSVADETARVEAAEGKAGRGEAAVQAAEGKAGRSKASAAGQAGSEINCAALFRWWWWRWRRSRPDHRGGVLISPLYDRDSLRYRMFNARCDQQAASTSRTGAA